LRPRNRRIRALPQNPCDRTTLDEAHGDLALAGRAKWPHRGTRKRMRAVAPIALLVVALVALCVTPPAGSLLGLSHDDFARGALGSAMLLWLTLSGLARAGQAGAARVFGGIALWFFCGFAGLAVYAFRAELSDVADRVLTELAQPAARVGPSGEVIVRRRYGGEFIVPGRVNERPVNFVFDTGASSVVLSAEDASAAGVPLDGLEFDVPVATANGSATAAPARLERISVGPIVVRGVRALVARPGRCAKVFWV